MTGSIQKLDDASAVFTIQYISPTSCGCGEDRVTAILKRIAHRQVAPPSVMLDDPSTAFVIPAGSDELRMPVPIAVQMKIRPGLSETLRIAPTATVSLLVRVVAALSHALVSAVSAEPVAIGVAFVQVAVEARG